VFDEATKWLEALTADIRPSSASGPNQQAS
jgi:hypothetical protein